jgi:hypothetical protein
MCESKILRNKLYVAKAESWWHTPRPGGSLPFIALEVDDVILITDVRYDKGDCRRHCGWLDFIHPSGQVVANAAFTDSWFDDLLKLYVPEELIGNPLVF